MADTTELNSQVTDAVSQTGLLVVGSAPAHSTGQSYEAMAHSTGLSFQNTIAIQQQGTLQSNAEAVLLTQHLLALGTAEVGAIASSFGQAPVSGLTPEKRSPPHSPRRARRSGRR